MYGPSVLSDLLGLSNALFCVIICPPILALWPPPPPSPLHPYQVSLSVLLQFACMWARLKGTI